MLESSQEFSAGERLQASEKLWGAAAHAVIAVARQREWPVSKHGNLKTAVQRLARQSDDNTLTEGFSAGERFHANFYHDFMSATEIAAYRPAVRGFVERMLARAGADPAPNSPPR